MCPPGLSGGFNVPTAATTCGQCSPSSWRCPASPSSAPRYPPCLEDPLLGNGNGSLLCPQVQLLLCLQGSPKLPYPLGFCSRLIPRCSLRKCPVLLLKGKRVTSSFSGIQQRENAVPLVVVCPASSSPGHSSLIRFISREPEAQQNLISSPSGRTAGAGPAAASSCLTEYKGQIWEAGVRHLTRHSLLFLSQSAFSGNGQKP